MSIHKRMNKTMNRTTWDVRYRDGVRNRSRSFPTEEQARDFDMQVAKLAAEGELRTLSAGQMPLEEFVDIWWKNEAKRNLAKSTLQGYATTYNNHIHPYLGHMPLKKIEPRAIYQWSNQLEQNGVGGPTIRTAMVVLQSCLRFAVVYGELSSNPVKEVRKPARRPRRTVEPLSPMQVEKIRQELIRLYRFREATFITVLAYAGLRPGEARALEWRHIRKNTLLVEQALTGSEVKTTKTGKSRSVMLLDALAFDLASWRSFMGNPSDGFVFEGTQPGQPWDEEAYKSWQRKGFQVAIHAAGIENARPYDLRHSFASLLIHSGRSPVDTAAQLGHAPTMSLDTYGHVFSDLDGDHRPPGELIAEARQNVFGNAAGFAYPTGGKTSE